MLREIKRLNHNRHTLFQSRLSLSSFPSSSFSPFLLSSSSPFFLSFFSLLEVFYWMSVCIYVCVCVGSLLGASGSFFLSRFLLRDLILRHVVNKRPLLKALDRSSKKKRRRKRSERKEVKEKKRKQKETGQRQEEEEKKKGKQRHATAHFSLPYV